MHLMIALCGLSARNTRVLSYVINSVRVDEHVFHAEASETVPYAHIAIVDAASSEGLELYSRLRETNPQLVSVTISADGSAGDSPYRIESRSLFLKIIGTLSELVSREIMRKTFGLGPAVEVPVAAPAPSRPASAPEDMRANAEEADAAPVSEHSLWALVVDDSAVTREQVRGALSQLGIGCEVAESAEMAMTLLEQCRFDIAFLDVVMPGADGYALCRRIRHNPVTRRMPVLMLTSRSSPFDRARGALAGCDTYLAKPITWTAFSQAIDKALLKHFHNDRAQMAARGYRR
ncbi:MAG: response regulator [Lysobacteraceae bacterium]|nr:MAG: response regulator [Xanthomonadaceae bacterium]